MKGAPEITRAAEAATRATMSGSFSRSWARTVATTWTSFLKPLTNSGRIGRSIRRLVRVSFWEGAPSRRGKLPGVLAPAVDFLREFARGREEVLIGLRALGVDGGGQHHGLAIGGQHRAVGLTGHAAGFQGQRLAA